MSGAVFGIGGGRVGHFAGGIGSRWLREFVAQGELIQTGVDMHLLFGEGGDGTGVLEMVSAADDVSVMRRRSWRIGIPEASGSRDGGK